MSVFRSLKDKMFSNPLLSKATENNDTPTAGYLYADIAKQTYEGGDAVERMGKELLQRLQHESPAVKIKVLMIMKYLLEKGHPEFQRFMRGQADDLKPCVNYRGPPDPLRGDAPSRLVREKAQVCLNLIYAYRADATANPVFLFQNFLFTHHQSQPAQMASMSSNGGATGMGSSGMSGFGGESSVGGRAVSNFRDPTNSSASPNRGTPAHWANRGPTAIQSNYMAPTKGPSLIESIQDTVSSGLGSLANSLGIKDDNNPSPVSSRYQSPAGMNSMNYHTHNHSSVDPTTAFQVSELQSNQPAGGWGDGSSNNSSPNRSTTYEQAAVTTLCLTRGNAIAPTRQELGQFMSKVRTSGDVTAIYEELTNRLADPNWKCRLRSLHGIYQVVSNGVSGSIEYFSQRGPYVALLPMKDFVQKTVQDQVGRILPLLRPDPSLTAPPPEPEVDDTSADLFGSMSLSGPEEEQGLFAGLNSSTPATSNRHTRGKTSGSNNVSASSGPLFGSMSVAQSTPSPTKSEDLLSSPVPVSSASPSLLETSSLNSSEGSLFELLTPSPPPLSTSQPHSPQSPPIQPSSPTPSSATDLETRPRQSSQKMLEPLFTPEAHRKAEISHIQQAYTNSPPPAYTGYPPYAGGYPPNAYGGYYPPPAYPQGPYGGQYGNYNSGPAVDFAAAASAPIEKGFAFVEEEQDPFAFVNQK